MATANPNARQKFKTITRANEICRDFGLAKSTLYYLISTGQFPRPVKIGKRLTGWLAADLEAWLASRATA